MMLLFSFDKKEKLDLEEKTLINQNAAFWSKALDLTKVEQREEKYGKVAREFREEIQIDEAILREGRALLANLTGKPDERKKIYACQKAVEELEAIVASKQESLCNSEKKRADWHKLKIQWSVINPVELESFRQAKAAKWAAKLSRIRFEKKANLFSMASSAFLIAKQIFTLATVCSNRVFMPLGVSVTMEFVGTACGVTNFFMKRILDNKKIPPVNLADYVSLGRLQQHPG